MTRGVAIAGVEHAGAARSVRRVASDERRIEGDATVSDGTAVDATAVDATVSDGTAVDATAVDATASDASAVDATAGDAAVLDFAMRRSARSLHAACAELLPGYAAASREPWRQALLTAGCLDGAPVRPAPRRPAPPLIVDDVVQPSDVLCALWLARRSGLFAAGSVCGDGVGRRSACEIVPRFAPGVSERTRDEVWAVLRGNTAWRAHRAARAAA